MRGRNTAPARLWAGLLLVLAMIFVGSPAQAGTPGQMVSLVNSARSSAGLPHLAHHSGLASVAQAWANTIASSGNLHHNPNAGSQIPSGWQRWAENVAYTSTPSASKLHGMFMNSPSHRANVMGDYTHIGIGYATGANGTGWAVEVFANYPGSTPSPTPTPKPTVKPAPRPSPAPAPTPT